MKLYPLMGSALLIGALLVCPVRSALAQIHFVPTDFQTVQEAIVAAADGDTVIVEEGTYFENIDFSGKAITVGSRFVLDADTTHISRTILDGSQASDLDLASVVRFVNGESDDSVLAGLTITGGAGSHAPDPYFPDLRAGGGILCANASPQIVHNRIVDNHVEGAGGASGGGIAARGSSTPLIQHNLIAGNTVSSPELQGDGGGLVIARDALVFDNVLRDNSATGGFGFFGSVGGGIMVGSLDPGNVRIERNLVQGNEATHAGGGIWAGFAAHAFILENQVYENTADAGGGLAIYSPGSVIRNVIAYNTAAQGGGLLVSQAGVQIINATIVGNTSCGENSGPGVLVWSAGPTYLLNAIVRDNTIECSEASNSSATDQMAGILQVHYSNVAGGFGGPGNIDLDPLFTTADFGLSAGSPSIDAGHPDSEYDDVEDPASPGSPLAPAMGSLRGDQGAYGSNAQVPLGLPLQGPLFSAFVEQVLATETSGRQALVNDFLAQHPTLPLIEENNIVYFIYDGSPSSVRLTGDMNGWDEAPAFTRLSGTTLWYQEAFYESDARLDYGFILNNSNWILDPRNPNQIAGPFGTNSELAMPAYVQPAEIRTNPGTPQGSIHTHRVQSLVLQNTRTVSVYTPFGYEQNVDATYPIILFHDGDLFLSVGSAPVILNNLIEERRIDPVIGVFVPPIDRGNEYAENKTAEFETFIVEELMPVIDDLYRTRTDPGSRAMTGISDGGLITTQICYNRPDAFGLSAPMSPSYRPPVLDNVLNGPKRPVKFYLDWGTYEESITTTARIMRDHLIAEGYDIKWSEWHEGHSWGSWRAHLDIALEYFFPGEAITPVESMPDVPSAFALGANYPNPFNTTTTISYELPRLSEATLTIYDVLGRQVSVLPSTTQPAGTYEVSFDATRLPSGVYFYRLQAKDYVETKRMVVVR